MATKAQRRRKAQQRAWESLRSRNRRAGRWTAGEKVTSSRFNRGIRDVSMWRDEVSTWMHWPKCPLCGAGMASHDNEACNRMMEPIPSWATYNRPYPGLRNRVSI